MGVSPLPLDRDNPKSFRDIRACERRPGDASSKQPAGPTFYYSFLSGSVLSRHLLLLQRGGATRGGSAMNLARIECEFFW